LAEDTSVAAVFAPSELETVYPGTVLAATDDMGREYLDRITFLGDSTTYGLIRYSMLRDGRSTKQVWTPVSGTLTLSQASITKIYYPDEDTELTITEAVEKKPPDILIITLGVNGISFMKQDYFVGEYDKLIASIQEKSPYTQIILQSILPVARSYPNQDQINNEKISEANGWIAELAQTRGVKYLDTYSALVSEDGYMPEEYQNGDGLHLNEISFQTELDYIRTHALTQSAENITDE
ncbi:MAG: GDSL-type esterase/lipase family protein, partial [Eubacteriales bacterium]